ncbi:MAG: DUF11 domain-containing protein [Euryarchaeota archaeon]|nr:DUF11 domain-containing protein [Euryarchaeota archaeon]
MRSVGMIAAVVLLLLMTPILATLISTSPPPGGIAIDGDFRDWTGIPEYADDPADQLANPDVNLVGYRVRVADGTMLLYARVSGSFFRAVAGGADVLYAFVDEDGDPATGFRVGSIGAERAVELYGWNGTLIGSAGWVYNADRAGPSSDDWLSFDRAEGGRAASFRNEVEARVDLGPAFLEDRARILVYALDFARNGDPADGAVGTALGAIAVTQRALGGDVVAGPSVPFLHLAVRALATPVQVVSLSLERFGSYPGPVSGDLYLDADGDGAVDPEDILLGTAAFAPDATFSLDREVSVPESYVFVANLPAAAPDASVGFRVASVAVAGGPEVAVTLRDASPVMAYVDSAPAMITADGAFGDWSRFALRLDADDDVQTLGGTASVNENIDLRAYEAVVSANVSFYLRVDGRMLGGVDIPNTRDRYHPATIVDTDGDTVPDEIEALINPALVSDFNNDYVSDLDQFDDVDQDGLLDYNKCTSDDCSAYTDYLLETRIPIRYPAPYAGRDVARYIGPISLPPQRGVDTAYVYVDRDNRTDTGLLVYVDGIPYGMDFAYEAVGRGGVILDAGLYAYNASRAIPWERFADAPTAVDAHQLEASFDASLFNLAANHTFVFFTKDWRFDFDQGRSGPQRAPGAWTRSIAGDNVVINELSPKPNPEWIEFANPTGSPVSVAGWTLQRQKGKNWVTVVTLSGTIGAWGSGTEYLTVVPPDNSLPNGGNLLRLVTADGVEVDRTRYDNVGRSQSWARFKDALTGKPVDTDADGNDFYRSVVPSPGRGNDRHRPRITVAKIADRTTAVPGETITYTVYYNNTDTGRASTVWVNDTLPSDVAFVSSSVPYASTDGSTYGWMFTNVNPLTLNSFTITVRVGVTATDGQVLANAVRLDYADQLGRILESSAAWANATVVRPMITIAKIVDKATALPGDTLTYTIYYNNTGSAPANHVWINDTLPGGVTYQSASPPPDAIDDATLRWYFTSVAVGSHSLTVTVTVDANPPAVLVNWAFLNYTAQNDVVLDGGSASAMTVIPEFETLVVPIAIPLLLYGLRRRWGKKRKG